MENPIPVLLTSVVPKIAYDALKFIIRKLRRAFGKTAAIKIAPLSSEPVQLVSKNVPLISVRLQNCLVLLNAHQYKAISYSRIAEACQSESVRQIEQYFTGDIEAPQSFLKDFCRIYNVNRNWLLHGEEKPFSHFSKIFQEVHEAAPYIADFSPATIYFVKTKSDYSPFCVVLKKYNSFSILHKDTNWMISSHTGGGGRGQTTSLYILITWLLKGSYLEWSAEDKKEIRFGIQSSFYGVELDNDDIFNDLVVGNLHPGFLDAHITRHCTSYWWEDFTDLKRVTFSKEKYAFCYGEQYVKAQDIVQYTLPRYKMLLGS